MTSIYRNKKELIQKHVASGAKVLDIGFYGQGNGADSPYWVHRLLFEQGADVWGLDLAYDEEHILGPKDHYRRGSAESFTIDQDFDVVFAGDIIEHLSNPGLFLDAVRKHIKNDGVLILTTPNAFNLFNLVEKLTKDEPTVNSDHTFYFNRKTLLKLLEKNRWKDIEVSYVYSLDLMHKESFKKKCLNVIYSFLSRLTPKFVETLVVIARPA